MLEGLAGRVRRLKGAGIELELTAEVAHAVKQDLEETITDFRKSVTLEFDRQVHAKRLDDLLEQVAQEVIVPALADQQADFRATVYVPDVLFKNVLYRLLDYYPLGGGHGKTYSTRFGIIGQTWRAQRSDSALVSADRETLIAEWGMTIAEATRSARRKRTFVCVVLKDEEAATAVGLLFAESEADNAFGSEIVSLLERAPSVDSLAEGVARVTERVRAAGRPPIAIVDD